MTRTASQTHPAAESGHARKPQALSISLEVLGSLLALSAIPLFLFNWLDVYLVFFGETPTVEDSNVTVYRVALGLLAAGTRPGAGRLLLEAVPARALGLLARLRAHPRHRRGAGLPRRLRAQLPQPPPAQESHPVCFGDTGDCPGG